jgi:hypothetical protein
MNRRCHGFDGRRGRFCWRSGGMDLRRGNFVGEEESTIFCDRVQRALCYEEWADRQLVEWILKNNTDPNRSFVIGYERAFRTREKPEGDPANGIYVLTATYKDHGAKDAPQTSIEGQHTVVFKSAL